MWQEGKPQQVQEQDSQELGFSLHHPCLVQGREQGWRDLGTKQTGQPCISAGEEAGVSKVNTAEVSKCEECLEGVLTGTRWGWISCASSHRQRRHRGRHSSRFQDRYWAWGLLHLPTSLQLWIHAEGWRESWWRSSPCAEWERTRRLHGSSVRDGLISPCNALLMHLSAAALFESKSSAVTQKPSSEGDGSCRGPPHLCGSRKILHF